MIKTHEVYYPMYANEDKFIILVTGGRGSGKSFGTSSFIERLTFDYNPDYNGNKVVHNVLYCRYTMTSAHISVIPEFLDKIELDGTQAYFKATKTDVMNLVTGSRIMFRGIKTSSGNQTAKLKSIHGVTVFVCDEAEEWTSEEEYDKIMLSIRQKGLKNLVIIIMNPTDSNHMIYQKYIKDTHRIEYFDGVPVQISTHPNVLHIHTTYLDNIEHLAPEFLKEVEDMKVNNPEKYAHVVMGQWSDVAEGAVFKKWGVVDEFPAWCKRVAIGLDFGYTHDPTAAVRCGIVDNRIYLDELDYRTGLLSTDIIKKLRPYDMKVIADSADPRLIQEIHNGGVKIYSVEKGAGSVLAGIDKMKEYEIYVTKRSYNLQRELRNYIWAKDKDGYYINEPEDHDNHCFVGETLITTNTGEKRIDEIKAGDYVLTSEGFRAVNKVFNNGYKKIVHYRLKFDGLTVDVKATPDHRIKTKEGWKQLQELTKGDILFMCKSSMVKSISSTKEKSIFPEELKGCTERCGNTTMVKSLKGIISTIRMKIHGTMISQILKWFQCMSICVVIILNIRTMKSICKSSETTQIEQDLWLQSGTNLMKEGNGTPNMLRRFIKTLSQRPLFATGARKSLKQYPLALIGFVQTNVKQLSDTILELIMKRENANGVQQNLSQTNIVGQSIAVENVQGSSEQALELKEIEIVGEDLSNVFDIEVDKTHEYFANGILVHNCMDAARYYILGEILGKIQAPKQIKNIFTH